MQAAKLRRLLVRLCGEPETASGGSHATFTSRDGKRRFTFAFHDGVEVSGSKVRSILREDVGLTLDEARTAVRKGKL